MSKLNNQSCVELGDLLTIEIEQLGFPSKIIAITGIVQEIKSSMDDDRRIIRISRPYWGGGGSVFMANMTGFDIEFHYPTLSDLFWYYIHKMSLDESA